MKYLGGKSRIAGKLAEFINNERGGRPYWEPFVGGAWVCMAVGGSYRYASDIHPALITLYTALRDGWEPPEELTIDEYNELKGRKDPRNPLTAFAGFACSYGGKYFGGFTGGYSGSRDYVKEAKKNLEAMREKIQGVEFHVADYRDCTPDGFCIYADPPYHGTTGYTTGGFNHSDFWEWVRFTSQRNRVFVSEYSAPPDFVTVLEIPRKRGLHGSNGPTQEVEKLFKWGGL